MSITIYTEEAQSTPYRPVFFDVSSDEATIVRMIADVYVDSSLKTTLDVEPKLGETDQFRIEVADVLKKELSSEFNEVTTTPEAFDQTTSAKEYYIRAFEVLDNGTTLDTSWSEAGAGTNYKQSTTKKTLNFTLNHEQKDDLSDYSLIGSSSLFGTNMPQNVYISKNQYFYLGGATPASVTYKVRLTEYTGLNGTGSSATTDSGTVSPSNRKINYGIDTSDLASTTKSFSLTAYDSSNVQKSQEFIVNLKDVCDDEVVMLWQSHYGVFDSYAFTGAYKQKTSTKKITHETRLAYDYAFEDRGLTDIKVTNNRTFDAYTTTESRDVVKWLAEIGESVDVRIQKTINGAKETIPIIVKKVSSRIEDTERGIYQIQITYEESNKRINQLG